MQSTTGTSFSIHHSQVDSLLKLKIGSLEGKVKGPDHEKLLENPILKFSGLAENGIRAELKVTVQIFSEGQPICFPVSTSYKSFKTRCNWNEWIQLPLRFSDLPRKAVLCFTVLDCAGPTQMIPVGGSTISIFGKHGSFRQGILDLRVWPGQVADGNTPSATPGKGPKGSTIYRLNKLTKKHRLGQLPKVDWLDRLTFSEIETVCEREKRESDFMFLNIEFPVAEYGSIQYSIGSYDINGESLDTFISDNLRTDDSQWFPDHEIMLDNLVENKHHTLSRLIRTGMSEAELKPNAYVRDQLNAIVSYPPTKLLSAEEQDLIWKFRYYLSSNKKALAKFLKCVKWAIAGEEEQALELLRRWAPMDVQDALELLGPQFAHPTVRSYAVARLQQAPDDDLLLYLLQLVQALKYEKYSEHGHGGESSPINLQESTESTESSAAVHQQRGSRLDVSHLASELAANSNPDVDDTIIPVTLSPPLSISSVELPLPPPPSVSHKRPVQGDGLDLASFLIYRACENTTLTNYFYWYLFIECEDHEVGVKQESHIREMYAAVMKRFIKCLKKGKQEWQHRRDLLSRQQKLIQKLVDVVKIVAKESASRPKKIEKLQSLLAETDVLKTNLSKFEPLPFALDPEVHIHGIIAKEATLFKSSQMPCKLIFMTTSGDPYIAIFKHGDDLRQDQLVLQIITLMDKLLRRENLDLKLTPYRVLATSTTHGFVQFIPSTTVADVLASEGTIQNFFRRLHPAEKELYGISPHVMQTYVKSCAGYCVITYLLGVGDRHLDNLLLTPEGKLFHIDFGYILGRDPKPMPPPMKLSKEMVEAMGGLNSEYYQEFRKLCYTAFLHLRRHANLILNLFSLMVGASVPDIALEPDKTVKKVLDKFQLELNDEAAVKYMQEVIDISVTAVMPALLEQVHKFTQMLRK